MFNSSSLIKLILKKPGINHTNKLNKRTPSIQDTKIKPKFSNFILSCVKGVFIFYILSVTKTIVFLIFNVTSIPSYSSQ